MTDVFFGPDEDGRSEKGRDERIAFAKAICGTCKLRQPCLERTIVYESMSGVRTYGVAGGMSESERKRFRAWMRGEGYGNWIPEGREFLASLAAFYRAEIKRKLKRLQRSA